MMTQSVYMSNYDQSTVSSVYTIHTITAMLPATTHSTAAATTTTTSVGQSLHVCVTTIL